MGKPKVNKKLKVATAVEALDTVAIKNPSKLKETANKKV